MLNVGDKVVIYSRGSGAYEAPKRGNPCAIHTILRVTPTRAYYRLPRKEITTYRDQGDFYDRGREYPSKPEEIAEAEAFLTAKRAKEDAAKVEREVMEANPAYQLAARLASVDSSLWQALGLERLRQIAAWLDETKGA